VSAFLIAVTLGASDPLAPLPVQAPAAERLVRRGEPVRLRLQAGALTISTAGRALTDGARGARVRVVALSTRRTLDGVVEGAGEVRIVTP
jgi:flagella basal body P-ring formation protein FlgA